MRCWLFGQKGAVSIFPVGLPRVRVVNGSPPGGCLSIRSMTSKSAWTRSPIVRFGRLSTDIEGCYLEAAQTSSRCPGCPYPELQQEPLSTFHHPPPPPTPPPWLPPTTLPPRFAAPPLPPRFLHHSH